MSRTRHCLPVLYLGILLAVGRSPVDGAQDSEKKITWTTSDGVALVGVYHPPRQARGRLWVLLHGLGSNKEEWLDFAHQLSEQGDGFLLYDARGHGQSVQRSNGGAIDYREFRTVGPGSEWDRMAGDLASAVDSLKTHFSLNPRRIAAGGASLGANVALHYASRHPDTPALILLSPGLEYVGVQTEQAFERYGKRPLFIAASPEDRYAYASVRRLIARRSDPDCVVAQGEGARHGVHMLTPDFTRRLLAWINGLPLPR